MKTIITILICLSACLHAADPATIVPDPGVVKDAIIRSLAHDEFRNPEGSRIVVPNVEGFAASFAEVLKWEILSKEMDRLEKSGAPVFHTAGLTGKDALLFVSVGPQQITSEEMGLLQTALNFDPVVRQAIVDGINRARSQKADSK